MFYINDVFVVFRDLSLLFCFFINVSFFIMSFLIIDVLIILIVLLIVQQCLFFLFLYMIDS